jgi:hypothetical protein
MDNVNGDMGANNNDNNGQFPQNDNNNGQFQQNYQRPMPPWHKDSLLDDNQVDTIIAQAKACQDGPLTQW